MRFLFASDSFKGSLSSERIIQLLKETARSVFPGCETKGVLVADGGEGTIDAVVRATEGTYRTVPVHGPLMEEVHAVYGVFGRNHAVIEMAAASGLPMVPPEKRNPLYTTSFGTGELIKDALLHGYRDITIAIGGSATNDGGMGAMRALGARFLDGSGRELSGMGVDLERVARIDMSGFMKAAEDARITVMCDVNNPLTGAKGAAFTFGSQKGGTPDILERLESGMRNYAEVIHTQLGIDVESVEGAGAAGGMGAALCVFLRGRMKSGIEAVLDLIEFDKLLEGTDLVVTGEGRMDWQSAFGKVPCGVAKRCKEKQIPVVAIVGGMGIGAENIYEFGVDSIISTINGSMDLSEAMERAEELYRSAAERMFRMMRVGIKLRGYPD